MKILPKGYTEKEWKILDQNFSGTELCGYCGFETDFTINPTKELTIECSHCKELMTVCSLCDECEGSCCERQIAKTLIKEGEDMNKIYHTLDGEPVYEDIANGYEESNMSGVVRYIKMCVYHTEINPEYKGDDNLSYIEVERDCVEYYYDNCIHNDFHSKIGESKFENWLIEYTADDTVGLVVFCEDRDAILKAYTPEGIIEYAEDYCPDCKLNFSYRKGNCKCHRCGKVLTAGSFIDDEEKMIDLFTMSKSDFLKFYSYLTEEEYNETIDEIVKRSGYWNTDWREDNDDKDGRVLREIVLGIMITEWLRKRGECL